MASVQRDLVNTPAQREKFAIEELVQGLRTVAAMVEHTSDPRAMRSIALQALREASRWIDLPANEPL